jgi:hypothetical protein
MMFPAALGGLTTLAASWVASRGCVKADQQNATMAFIGIAAVVYKVANDWVTHNLERRALKQGNLVSSTAIRLFRAVSLFLMTLEVPMFAAMHYFVAKRANGLIPSFIESFGLYMLCRLSANVATQSYEVIQTHRASSDTSSKPVHKKLKT